MAGSSTAIKSREIVDASGDTKRVQIGSKAEQKYLSSGYKPVTDAATSGSLVKPDATKDEPAVLSTANAETNFASNVQPEIDKANDTIKKFTETKNTLTAEDIDDLEYLGLSEDDEGKTIEQVEYETNLKSLNKERKDAEKLYKDLVTSATSTASATISGLTTTYMQRLDDLKKSNTANLATWQQQFIRSGQAEYSPGMTSNFLTAKEMEGLRKVQDLDATYQSAVAQVNSALGEKKFSAAASLASTIRSIEKDINDQMLTNFKEAKKVNESIRKNDAIYNAFAAGITDSLDVYEYVREQGVNATIEEVDDILGILNPSADLSGLTADYRTYKAMKDSGEIPETWTYFDFTAAAANSRRKPGSSSSNQSSTYSDPLTFEEWIAQKEEQDQMTIFNPEKFRDEYNSLKESDQLPTKDYMIPDSTKNYTASNIPSVIDELLVEDILDESNSIDEIYNEYDDVSTTYINSLWGKLRPAKKSSSSRSINPE